MANIKLLFNCSIADNVLDVDLWEKDFIKVRMTNKNSNSIDEVIYLNKSTAIKFAKTLRTEINKIQS